MATKTKEKTPSPPVEYASAMDKIRDEMAKNGGRYVQVVGEYMTAYLLQHPEAEAAILTEGKTIAGSLKVMEAEARKVKQGNVAVLDDRTAFGIVLQYYGLNAGDVSKTGENVSKTGENVSKNGENVLKTGKNVTAEAGTSSVTADAVPPDARRLARACGPQEGKAFGETGKTAAPDLFDLEALLGVI